MLIRKHEGNIAIEPVIQTSMKLNDCYWVSLIPKSILVGLFVLHKWDACLKGGCV
jgi:hypothetical protein